MSGRVRRHAGVLLPLLGLALGSVSAQDPLGAHRRQATRAEIEAAVTATEAVVPRSDEKTREKLLATAASMKQRLKNGDFAPGDRIYLVVQGDSALTDTFTVRQDQRLLLPNIPELSLRGVLDSELPEFLTREVGRYVREPKITAIGLVDVTLTGGVGRPGFVTVPSDMRVTDVLMAQGGPSPNAELDKAYVKRGTETLLDRKQLSEALRSGRTIGDVALRDGDEIVIPVQQTSRWGSTWIPILTSVTGLFWIIRGSRRGRVTP